MSLLLAVLVEFIVLPCCPGSPWPLVLRVANLLYQRVFHTCTWSSGTYEIKFPSAWIKRRTTRTTTLYFWAMPRSVPTMTEAWCKQITESEHVVPICTFVSGASASTQNACQPSPNRQDQQASPDDRNVATLQWLKGRRQLQLNISISWSYRIWVKPR